MRSFNIKGYLYLAADYFALYSSYTIKPYIYTWGISTNTYYHFGFLQVSLHCLKTYTLGWLDTPNCLSVLVYESMCVICNWLVTSPGCIPASHLLNAAVPHDPD